MLNGGQRGGRGARRGGRHGPHGPRPATADDRSKAELTRASFPGKFGATRTVGMPLVVHVSSGATKPSARAMRRRRAQGPPTLRDQARPPSKYTTAALSFRKLGFLTLSHQRKVSPDSARAELPSRPSRIRYLQPVAEPLLSIHSSKSVSRVIRSTAVPGCPLAGQ